MSFEAAATSRDSCVGGWRIFFPSIFSIVAAPHNLLCLCLGLDTSPFCLIFLHFSSSVFVSPCVSVNTLLFLAIFPLQCDLSHSHSVLLRALFLFLSPSSLSLSLYYFPHPVSLFFSAKTQCMVAVKHLPLPRIHATQALSSLLGPRFALGGSKAQERCFIVALPPQHHLLLRCDVREDGTSVQAATDYWPCLAYLEAELQHHVETAAAAADDVIPTPPFQ